MIKLILLDVDGVLTDGTKTYGTDGQVLSKRFNDKDFTAIKRFKASNVNVAFLSGDNCVNLVIAKKRNIDFYSSRNIDGTLNKLQHLKPLSERYGCQVSEICFVGDDLFDIDIMENVGHAYCPSDAVEDLKSKFKILDAKGGSGVVAKLYERLVSDGLVLKSLSSDVVALDAKEF